MKNIIFVLSVLVLLNSCKKDNVEPNYKNGYFVLTQLDNPNFKTATIISDSIKSEFQLGDIKASKEFYFILSNGSNSSIFDVTFESSNSAFEIFPKKISEMQSSNANQNLVPLISLNVVHGVRLNGIGFTNTLPMNLNTAEISVRGKVLQSGDTVLIESKFKFEVNAKLMDIILLNNDKEVNLTNFVSVYNIFGGMRGYELESQDITIKNSGNVDINFSYHIQDEGGDVTQSLIQVIAINESQSLKIDYFSIIELESDGTITNNNRIQLFDNGNGYMTILPYMP